MSTTQLSEGERTWQGSWMHCIALRHVNQAQGTAELRHFLQKCDKTY